MKKIILFLLLNSSLFAGSKMIIKTDFVEIDTTRYYKAKLTYSFAGKMKIKNGKYNDHCNKKATKLYIEAFDKNNNKITKTFLGAMPKLKYIRKKVK